MVEDQILYVHSVPWNGSCLCIMMYVLNPQMFCCTVILTLLFWLYVKFLWLCIFKLVLAVYITYPFRYTYFCRKWLSLVIHVIWSCAHGWQWQNWQSCMSYDVGYNHHMYYSWVIYCHSRSSWGNTMVLLKCKPTECEHIIHATITVSSNFNTWKLNVYDNFKHIFSQRKYLSCILNPSVIVLS